MKNFKCFILALILSLAGKSLESSFFKNLSFFPVAWAQSQTDQAISDEVKASAKVDKPAIQIHENLLYSITVESPENWEIEIPEFQEKISTFKIIDFGKNKPIIDEGRRTQIIWYKLKPDSLGSHILPALSLTYWNPTYADKKNHILTSEIFVEVLNSPSSHKDQGGQGLQKLKDIKDLEPFSYKFLMPWILGTLVILALVCIGVIFFKKRNKNQIVIQEEILSPYQVAIRELKILEGELATRGREKFFHFRLSEILRVYISTSFSFMAIDMTTDEIRKNLHQLSILDDGQKKNLLKILEKNDLVKFTDYTLTPEEDLKLLQEVCELVEQTAPILDQNKQAEVGEETAL